MPSIGRGTSGRGCYRLRRAGALALPVSASATVRVGLRARRLRGVDPLPQRLEVCPQLLHLHLARGWGYDEGYGVGVEARVCS